MRRLVLLLIMLPFFAAVMVAVSPDGPSARHWNHSRGYTPFLHATPDCILIDASSSAAPISDSFNFGTPTSSLSLSFRAADLTCTPKRDYSRKPSSGWNVFLTSPGNDMTDTLCISVCSVEITDPVSSRRALRMKGYWHEASTHGGAESSYDPYVFEENIDDGVDYYAGVNLWSISVRDGMVTVAAGNRGLRPVASFPAADRRFSAFGFTSSPATTLSVSDISLHYGSPAENPELTQWSNPDHLRNYLSASTDPLEGYWTLFDRTLEESLLRMGGDYRLAIVRDSSAGNVLADSDTSAPGNYLIIYLSGARVNGKSWQPGMVKGRLKADPFPGVYSVEWIDSEGGVMSHDIKAQTGEGDVLTIQFPYQQSTLRLRKYSVSPAP